MARLQELNRQELVGKAIGYFPPESVRETHEHGLVRFPTTQSVSSFKEN